MSIQEPIDEKCFPFHYVDSTGKVWEGTFHYRRPGLRDLLRIEAERTRLCEGQALDPEYRALASLMARLKIVLRVVPKWLDWDTLRDVGLLGALGRQVEETDTGWFQGGAQPGGGSPPGGAPTSPGP